MKIARLPLTCLHHEDGTALVRQQDLTVDDVRSLLAGVPVRFVVANIGDELRWIKKAQTFAFWKSDVREHLGTIGGDKLGNFEGDYFYCASAWRRESDEEWVVLLEVQH